MPHIGHPAPTGGCGRRICDCRAAVRPGRSAAYMADTNRSLPRRQRSSGYPRRHRPPPRNSPRASPESPPRRAVVDPGRACRLTHGRQGDKSAAHRQRHIQRSGIRGRRRSYRLIYIGHHAPIALRREVIDRPKYRQFSRPATRDIPTRTFDGGPVVVSEKGVVNGPDAPVREMTPARRVGQGCESDA